MISFHKNEYYAWMALRGLPMATPDGAAMNKKAEDIPSLF